MKIDMKTFIIHYISYTYLSLLVFLDLLIYHIFNNEVLCLGLISLNGLFLTFLFGYIISCLEIDFKYNYKTERSD